jgi:hypothetical protein
MFKIFLEKIESGSRVEYYFMSAFFFIGGRSFLETLSNSSHLRIEKFAYFYSWYFSLFAIIILTLNLLTAEPIGKVTRVVLSAAAIVHIPPLLDIFLSSDGKTYFMSHVPAGSVSELIDKYLTFFGDFSGRGITPGIRIEVFLILMSGALYSWVKTKSYLRTMAIPIVLYTVIYIFCAETVFFEILSRTLFGDIQRSDIHLLVLRFNTILFLSLMFIIYYRWNSVGFSKQLNGLYWKGFAHFQFSFIIGLSLGMKYLKNDLSIEFILSIFLMILSNFFGWLFLEGLNSNRQVIVHSENKSGLNGILFLLTLICSFIVSSQALFLSLFILGCGYMYLMPPIRFEGVKYISKLPLAVASLATILLGSIVAGNHDEFLAFSGQSSLAYVFLFTIFLNFVDIKDKLNFKYYRLFIGSIFLLFFCIAGLIMIFRMFDPLAGTLSIGIGFSEFLLINRKKYNEFDVFLLYLLSSFLFLLYIIFGNGAALILK